MLCIKMFRIRLSEDHRAGDEAFLNDFLESCIPERVDSGLVHHPTDPFWSVLVIYRPRDEETVVEGERVLFDSYEPLTPDEEMLFMRLKAWRDRQAREENLPPYQVLHDAHLMTLAKIKPRNAEEMNRVKGLSARKVARYMDALSAFFRKE